VKEATLLFQLAPCIEEILQANAIVLAKDAEATE
jgi:hypothetical protein